MITRCPKCSQQLRCPNRQSTFTLRCPSCRFEFTHRGSKKVAGWKVGVAVVAVVVLVVWQHNRNEERKIQAQAEQDASVLRGLLDYSRSTPTPNAMGDLTRIPPAPAFQPFQGPNIQTHTPVVTINPDGSRSTTWVPKSTRNNY